MKCSIIIPTFNAEKYIEASIHSLRVLNTDCEIIVSDGGSTDRTLTFLASKKTHVVSSGRGRGVQLNEGARHAKGDILFFLHADSLITQEVFPAIERLFKDKNVQVAKCILSFDQKHWLLRCYAQLAKIDSIWTSFGDQGIIVRRAFFNEIGGFPNWPLLEDVNFFQKARSRTRIRTLPSKLITSAERFVRNGIVRQQLFNARIVLKYLLGTPPVELSSEYENFRGRK